MAYISEVAIEIRAPIQQAEKLEQFRATFRADEETEDDLYPNPGRAILDQAEIVQLQKEGVVALRFFTAYMKGAEGITTALYNIEGGAEEQGWSGTWRRLGEDDGDMEHSYWGDDERKYDAIFWRRGLEPQWLNHPLLLDQEGVAKITGQYPTGEELAAVLDAARPEIETAIRKAAEKVFTVRAEAGEDQ